MPNENPKAAAKYEVVVAAIVKAVPEIWEWQPTVNNKQNYGNRPITLEDVLRAVHKPEDIFDRLHVGLKHGEGLIYLSLHSRTRGAAITINGVDWHLGHDLAWHRDNAPETIDFLHSILC